MAKGQVVSTRIPAELLERVERTREVYRRQLGRSVSRAEALRYLIDAGADAALYLEAKEKKS